MAEGRMVDAADLELAPALEPMPDLDLRAARLRAEREVIQVALARSNYTLSAAARLLGISRPTLYGLMDAHGIDAGPAKGIEPAADSADELVGYTSDTIDTTPSNH
jgi:two-component system NtrC family response regulator